MIIKHDMYSITSRLTRYQQCMIHTLTIIIQTQHRDTVKCCLFRIKYRMKIFSIYYYSICNVVHLQDNYIFKGIS
jgi:hypothetical protein